jgi:hypothetical protein
MEAARTPRTEWTDRRIDEMVATQTQRIDAFERRMDRLEARMDAGFKELREEMRDLGVELRRQNYAVLIVLIATVIGTKIL